MRISLSSCPYNIYKNDNLIGVDPATQARGVEFDEFDDIIGM